jgi:hypothetical protein
MAKHSRSVHSSADADADAEIAEIAEPDDEQAATQWQPAEAELDAEQPEPALDHFATGASLEPCVGEESTAGEAESNGEDDPFRDA